MARQRVVHDEVETCPYLDGRSARMPLRWQFDQLTGAELDASLEAGDRRVGRMLYRTKCPACSACEPLRIPIQGFRPSKSQRKVIRKNKDLRLLIGPATFSEEKLAMFNRHKFERGLALRDKPMTEEGYVGWFLRSCVRTVEMQYLLDDKLVGLGILDVGRDSISSVYFYFDPDHSKRSLGTYSVLAELAWWRQQGGRHHYLGLFVEDCRRLSYKASYFPHERRVNGEWQRFETKADLKTAPHL